ncbi:hypothetical protein [[Flexibacter] sp. ATCC 35103]|uniref:hypothetical protein n=1 Tax=[Flexibacter] sp. ATCC 35103 TaxID=1937528 RepID=UPI0013F68A75|nr:hypothetical protein [[Flexibacter] sp. ATCC 35103]
MAFIQENILNKFKKSKLSDENKAQTVEEFINNDPNHKENNDTVHSSDNLDNKNE